MEEEVRSAKVEHEILRDRDDVVAALFFPFLSLLFSLASLANFGPLLRLSSANLPTKTNSFNGKYD
ncbi:MAG: hypothetical protein CL912_18305 [Deltaproteobacteria bacterium]|nr:hypothetical protein [Deltaproteobacteria bacterium]